VPEMSEGMSHIQSPNGCVSQVPLAELVYKVLIVVDHNCQQAGEDGWMLGHLRVDWLILSRPLGTG